MRKNILKEIGGSVFAGCVVFSILAVLYVVMAVYTHFATRNDVPPDPIIDEILCITQVAKKGEPITFSAQFRGEWKIVRTVEGQMLLVEECE